MKNRIWKECIDFSDGCDEEYWLDANVHLHIVSHMFNVNILLYDVNEHRTTYFYETKQIQKKQKLFKGYIIPDSLTVQSIHEKIIALLRYSHHYQYIEFYGKSMKWIYSSNNLFYWNSNFDTRSFNDCYQ